MDTSCIDSALVSDSGRPEDIPCYAHIVDHINIPHTASPVDVQLLLCRWISADCAGQ
jgi:hypothetical protein